MAARNYVDAIWGFLKSQPPLVATYFASIPDLGDPRNLAGFPPTILDAIKVPNISTASVATTIQSGLYSLRLLREKGERIHYWNWDANSASTGFAAQAVAVFAPPPAAPAAPVDITDSIPTEPPAISYAEWSADLDPEVSPPSADADDDGVENYLEFVLGGDPIDPASTPRLTPVLNGGSMEIVLTVPKLITGAALVLETSTDLTQWNPAPSPPTVLSETVVSRTVKWTILATGSRLFVRARATAISEEARLAGLTISQGTLTQPFSTFTTNYGTTVVHSVSSLAVTPTALAGGATVQVNGVAVASGSPSPNISLNEGLNVIAVLVTAADGVAAQTYVLNVTRLTALETWRQAYFGSPADAGVGADATDADGDGQTNFFEYVGGLDPMDATDQFSLRVEPVPGQSTERNIVFGPRLPDRTYTVKYKLSLSDAAWIPLPGGIVTDNGTERTVTDPFATEPGKFYIVEIGKP